MKILREAKQLMRRLQKAHGKHVDKQPHCIFCRNRVHNENIG